MLCGVKLVFLLFGQHFSDLNFTSSRAGGLKQVYLTFHIISSLYTFLKLAVVILDVLQVLRPKTSSTSHTTSPSSEIKPVKSLYELIQTLCGINKRIITSHLKLRCFTVLQWSLQGLWKAGLKHLHLLHFHPLSLSCFIIYNFYYLQMLKAELIQIQQRLFDKSIQYRIQFL